MIDPNVFGGLINPDGRVCVTAVTGLTVGERYVAGDAGFEGIHGDKIAGIGVCRTNGVGCSVVWVLLGITKFAGKANRYFASADFDRNVEAACARPSLDVLETAVSKTVVKSQQCALING